MGDVMMWKLKQERELKDKRFQNINGIYLV